MDTRLKNSRKLVVWTVIVLSFCSVFMILNYDSFRYYYSPTEREAEDAAAFISSRGNVLATGNYLLCNEISGEATLTNILDEYGETEFSLARKYLDCEVYKDGEASLGILTEEASGRLLGGGDEDYGFRALFTFTEDGGLSGVQVTGSMLTAVEEYEIQNRLISEVEAAAQSYLPEIVSAPAGVTIGYGMSEAQLNEYMEQSYPDAEGSYEEMGVDYGSIFSTAAGLGFLAGAAALFLPFLKGAGRWKGKIFETPFEIVLLALSFLVIPMEVMGNLAGNMIYRDFPFQDIVGDLPALIFNFAGWFLIFGMIFWIVTCYREILTMGMSYWRERTLTARWIRRMKEGEGTAWKRAAGAFADGVRSIKDFFRKQYDALLHMDFQDRTNRSILRVVLLNFGILVLVCMLWYYGVFALIVYSVLLFFFLRRFMNDLQEKYGQILAATSQLAEGHLDVPIQGDAGLFTPVQEELKKVQAGFKKAVEEEVKNERMKTELVTNVSHDLRTPLTAIITYVDLLKNESDEQKRQEYIGVLERKSLRLKVLIEDLFEISKAASKNVVMHYMQVDIVDLLKQVGLENESRIREAELEFRWKLPEHKVIMWLDSQKTYRIFENLIVNITKYAMPHTRAYVEMTDQGDSVHISMKNISSAELTFDTEEITDRFVRGDSARNTEGSGLGLAIARSFTELQQGSLRISTEADLFRADIDLPKQEMPEEATPQPDTSPVVTGQSDTKSNLALPGEVDMPEETIYCQEQEKQYTQS